MVHMFKQYGYLTVATYLGVYVVTLAGLYALVRTGLVEGPDVNTFLNNWFVKKALYADEIKLSDKAVDFGMAWLLTKTTEPVRLVVTLALMPVVVRRSPAWLLRLFRAAPKDGAAAAAGSATLKDAAAKAASAPASAAAASKQAADAAIGATSKSAGKSAPLR